MAFRLRGRRTAYDNIAVGSATGRERTILGQTPSTEAIGGGTGGSTDPAGATSSTTAKDYSNKAVASANNTSDPFDNISVGNVTGTSENVAVGG